MGTRNRVSLDILDDTDMKEVERKTVQLEKLEAKKEKALKKKGGIFAGDTGDEALPSSIIRKRRKKEASGLKGGRLEESTEKLVGDKIKAETEEKFSRTESIMNALGFGKGSKSKVTKDSLVSGAGSPIQKSNEFKKLSNKVSKIQTNQKALAESLTTGGSLVQGAAGLRTPSGIFGAGIGIASKIPHVAIAITAAKLVYDKFVLQFGDGGTRDTRKKVLAEDVSDIGVETESDITSGRKLFLSNPMTNQGIPSGNSNTQMLRDGTRIHKLRKEGTYF